MTSTESDDTGNSNLLSDPLEVICVGLEGFVHDLESQNVNVVQVDWSPPAGGDAYLAELLSKLGA